MPPFCNTFFHVLAIDDDHSTICTRIDMIHTQNNLWNTHHLATLQSLLKPYTVRTFFCLLQHVESHDVEKL